MQALFKARFEQALDSQKLNIKKLEQQLRRMGVNPDDPVAMASIQRVASTFFNAIDKKEGSPYVFHGDKLRAAESTSNIKQAEPEDDSDQEELDKFIAEIEDAADREWEAEEAAEQEEASKLRYWNKEDMDGRSYRPELVKGDYDDDESKRGARSWKDKNNNRQRINHTEDDEDNDDDDNDDDDDEEWNASYARAINKRESDAGDADKFREKFTSPKVESRKAAKFGKRNNDDGFQIKIEDKFRGKLAEKVSESDEMLSDLDDAMWESDDKGETVESAESRTSHQYKSSSDEESSRYTNDAKNKVNGMKNQRNSVRDQKRSSEDLFSDSEILMWESDDEEESGTSTHGNKSVKTETVVQKNKNSGEGSKMRTAKEADETWDSD